MMCSIKAHPDINITHTTVYHSVSLHRLWECIPLTALCDMANWRRVCKLLGSQCDFHPSQACLFMCHCAQTETRFQSKSIRFVFRFSNSESIWKPLFIPPSLIKELVECEESSPRIVCRVHVPCFFNPWGVWLWMNGKATKRTKWPGGFSWWISVIFCTKVCLHHLTSAIGWSNIIVTSGSRNQSLLASSGWRRRFHESLLEDWTAHCPLIFWGNWAGAARRCWTYIPTICIGFALSSTIWGKPPQSESPRRKRKFILHSLHHASTNDVGSKPLYAQSCRLTLNDLIIGITCPLTTTQSQLRSGLQDTFERVISLFYFSTISHMLYTVTTFNYTDF